MAAKGLKTLIRLARWEVDERRRALSALQAREDEIVAMLEAMSKQLPEEQSVAAGDATGAGFLYGAFANAWVERRDQVISMLVQIRAQVEQARDALAEAFRQQKTYELTQAARERREREEADRKEQAVLDETGLNIYRRRGRQETEDQSGG
jgi:flagellar export protein FliJ